jgi:hypothetical protein
VAIEDEMDPDVLRTAVSLRHMLEATLDAWRTTLPEEIPLVAVVIKAAEQTADLLSETL